MANSWVSLLLMSRLRRNRQALSLNVQRAALRKPRSRPRRQLVSMSTEIAELEHHLARLQALSRDETCHFATVFSVGAKMMATLHCRIFMCDVYMNPFPPSLAS